jgi:outer membrane protein
MIHFSKTLSFFAMLTLLPAISANAQNEHPQFNEPDTLEIDLYRSIAIALGDSPDAYFQQNNVDQSYISFRSTALDMFAPRIDMDLLAPSLQQALSEQLVFDPDQGQTVRQWVESENERLQGQLSIDQPLPTGGNFQLESTFYRRFYTSDITGDENDEEYSSSYRASFTQELLRGNLRRYAREQAEIAYERQLINSRQSQRQLVFNVLQAYYDLLAQWRQLEISRADLEANRETANLAQRKYEAGLIPEVEAMQLEVEAARVEMELLSAEANYEGQLDSYRDLVGISLIQPIRVVGDPGFDAIEVSLDDAIELALEHRQELRLATLSVEQAELGLKNARRPWGIGGQITAFYNLDLRTDVFESSVSSEYNDYAVNRGFAFNVNIPLFGGGRKNLDVQSAVLTLRRAEYEASQAEQDVILDVRSAVRSLNESRRRYEISLASLEIVDKSFDISRQRFVNGQITAREWIDAQISINQSRISASRALMDHNVALARYRLTVGEPVLPGVVINSPQPDPDL